MNGLVGRNTVQAQYTFPVLEKILKLKGEIIGVQVDVPKSIVNFLIFDLEKGHQYPRFEGQEPYSICYCDASEVQDADQ